MHLHSLVCTADHEHAECQRLLSTGSASLGADDSTGLAFTTACGRRVAAAMRVMLMELVLLARMALGCTVCAAQTRTISDLTRHADISGHAHDQDRVLHHPYTVGCTGAANPKRRRILHEKFITVRMNPYVSSQLRARMK